VSVLLALVAAVAYGVSDFVGGLASRRASALRVLLLSYPAGVLPMLVVLPLLLPGRLDAATIGWSVAAGLAGTGGVLLLYIGLAIGPMGVVAPLTAVAGAVVPAGVGIALGDRPPAIAYAGVALALLAVVVVSRGPEAPGSGGRAAPRTIAIASVAGVAFGLYFVLLSAAPETSGGWPLLISRVAASVAVLGIALAGRRPLRGDGRVWPFALAAGALDAAANLGYLLAVRQGMLALVPAVVALYPAATILLARLVLGERTGAVQRLGMVAAAGSVVLIAAAG